MGRRKHHGPKRGSLSFLPRGRTSRWVGRIRSWPRVDGEARLLALPGYKAGMTYCLGIDNRQGSLSFGKEVMYPATIVETPPLVAVGIRTYVNSSKGLQTYTEAWMEKPPAELSRSLTLPEKFDPEKMIGKIKEGIDRITEIRILGITKPKAASSADRKRPELIEIKVGGGDVKEQLDYAQKILGKEVRVTDVFKDGQFVDVIGVTKGKGIQGPVKRWGVSKLHHKSRKTVRGVGSIGAWHPHFVMYSVPRAGQMGFFQRTEYNKQIIKVGTSGAEVTPKGGITHYGRISSDYLLIMGSTPGAAKRQLLLRFPMRPPKVQAAPTLEQVRVETQ